MFLIQIYRLNVYKKHSKSLIEKIIKIAIFYIDRWINK